MNGEELEALVEKYFAPYLNVAKKCIGDKYSKECFPNVYYKTLKGEQTTNYSNSTSSPQFVLADGTSILFTQDVANCMATNNRCLVIGADINGHKKPNVFGRDYYQFSFYPKTGEFLPNGAIDPTKYDEATNTYKRRTLKEVISSSCDNNNHGWYCATRLVMEGFKMNY